MSNSTKSLGCVQCGIEVSSARELYCICERALRTYHGGEVENVAIGFVAGIPFLMPSGFAPTVEIVEGEDLVVETPLPVCNECWNQLDGGAAYRMLSSCSQLLGTSAVLTLFFILFTKMRDETISLWWPLGMFAAAIPPFALAERIRSHWETRLKHYLRRVAEYDALLNAFPSLEVRTRRPNALTGPQPSNDEH